MNRSLLTGHKYFNVFRLDLCPGGPGSGPVGGLCFTDLSPLFIQLALPIGTVPFHFLATGVAETFGPYPLSGGLSVGLMFEAAFADVTGGVLGCISPAIRYTIQ